MKARRISVLLAGVLAVCGLAALTTGCGDSDENPDEMCTSVIQDFSDAIQSNNSAKLVESFFSDSMQDDITDSSFKSRFTGNGQDDIPYLVYYYSQTLSAFTVGDITEESVPSSYESYYSDYGMNVSIESAYSVSVSATYDSSSNDGTIVVVKTENDGWKIYPNEGIPKSLFF